MASQIRVLLADDSEPMRHAIRRLIETDRSLTLVHEVASYSELLKTLHASKPDVVVMDVHMPGLKDFDSFRQELAQTCLVAISFWADEETSMLVQRFGAFRFLDKGQLVATLIPTIHECGQPL
jgi:DNA-binding NarL/FixJ family response regulator